MERREEPRSKPPAQTGIERLILAVCQRNTKTELADLCQVILGRNCTYLGLKRAILRFPPSSALEEKVKVILQIYKKLIDAPVLSVEDDSISDTLRRLLNHSEIAW